MRVELLSQLSRRASFAVLAAATSVSLPGLDGMAHAAASSAAASGPLAQLTETQQTLKAVDGMLLEPPRWNEAQKLLNGLDVTVITKALDACADPASMKENLMNSAAFIVYYEEARYGDLRLEPQAPNRRAEQNGKKREFLRALADERAELTFLIRQQKAGSDAIDGDDVSDLRAYSTTAQRTLQDFLDLVFVRNGT